MKKIVLNYIVIKFYHSKLPIIKNTNTQIKSISAKYQSYKDKYIYLVKQLLTYNFIVSETS